MITNHKTKNKGGNLQSILLFSSIIVIGIVFGILIPDFFSLSTLSTIFITMAMTCVIALGTTFVLTSGEIDISMGAMLSVATVIVAVLARSGMPVGIAMLISAAVTIGLGFLNGFLTVKVGIPSFVATLGVNGVAMGLSRIISNNGSIKLEDETFLGTFGRKLGDSEVQMIIIWLIALTIIAFIIFSKTRFGREVQCTGDNREAAFLYGINTNKTVILAFIVSAIFTFMAAMLMLARSGFASPGEGESYTLPAIVAAVVGGTSIRGGKGSIIGGFFGAFFLSIISNGLFLLKFNAWTANIITGIIIVIVLTISSLSEQRSRELSRT